MRPQFVHPEYPNDFAAWAHYGLHDDSLAEKLAILDPTEFSDLEDLRQIVLDVIEESFEDKEN